MQLTITVEFDENTRAAAARELRDLAEMLEPAKTGMADEDYALDNIPRKAAPEKVAEVLDDVKPAKKSKAKKTAAVVEEETPQAALDIDDEDFTPQPTETVSFDEDDEDVKEEEPPAAKKTAAKKEKAKKITLDDVNDACRAHAAARGRAATLAVLQKKFKTHSVTALKPEQWESCVAAMAVN
jgi:uncharacterized cupredoxin-like copper-binding protein